jgi:hypothetical protein
MSNKEASLEMLLAVTHDFQKRWNKRMVDLLDGPDGFNRVRKAHKEYDEMIEKHLPWLVEKLKDAEQKRCRP